jgi:hypothetical protein
MPLTAKLALLPLLGLLALAPRRAPARGPSRFAGGSLHKVSVKHSPRQRGDRSRDAHDSATRVLAQIP